MRRCIVAVLVAALGLACAAPRPAIAPPSTQCWLPVAGNTYNLTAILVGAHFATDNDTQLSVSACGQAPVIDPTCDLGCAGYELLLTGKCYCLGKPDQPFVTTLSTGVQVDFLGGDARTDPTGVSSLSLRLICADAEQEPTLQEEDPLYHYVVEWKTPTVCASVPTPTPSPCSISVDGASFDLSVLGNGAVARSYQNQYTVNPCGQAPLPQANCDEGCIGYQVDAQGNCWCLGKPGPTKTGWLTDGAKLVFGGGASRANPSGEMVLELDLQCAATLTDPVWVQESPTYYYSISWASPAVCPQDRPTPTPTPVPGSCMVTVGDATYDFSQLSGGVEFTVNNTAFTTILSANPCGDAARIASDCPSGCTGYLVDGTGACWCLGKLGMRTSSALANGVELDFGGGSSRSSPSGISELQLQLLCATTEVKPTTYNEITAYHYQVVWETPAACGATPTPTPPPHPCDAVVDGELFPTSYLTSATFRTSYFAFSVTPCGQPKPKWYCDTDNCVGYKWDDSSCVCLGAASTIHWSSSEYNTLVAEYSNGTHDVDPAGTYSLRLRFVCDSEESKPTGLGSNVKYAYQAEWRTPLVCSDRPTPTPTPTPTPRGRLCDAQVGDLAFPISLVPEVQFEQSGSLYRIHPCGVVKPSPLCPNDCAAYRIDETRACWCLGKASVVRWDFIDDRLTGWFSDGQNPDGSISQAMQGTFKCAEVDEQPTSISVSQTLWKLDWTSPHACGVNISEPVYPASFANARPSARALLPHPG